MGIKVSQPSVFNHNKLRGIPIKYAIIDRKGK